VSAAKSHPMFLVLPAAMIVAAMAELTMPAKIVRLNAKNR
jgi:hypothetical protein